MIPRTQLTTDEMLGILQHQLGDFYASTKTDVEPFKLFAKPPSPYIECEWYRTEDRGEGEKKYWYSMRVEITDLHDITGEVAADVTFHAERDEEQGS